jgi:hypothetical protein
MSEFVCVNDEEFNCGTVKKIERRGVTFWVHTGNPNASNRKDRVLCDKNHHKGATPSTMEIQ